MEGLLGDTAAAVWAVERERGAEAQAHRLLQGPTLETMLLRMEEMEVSSSFFLFYSLLRKQTMNLIHLGCGMVCTKQ